VVIGPDIHLWQPLQVIGWADDAKWAGLDRMGVNHVGK
jgi:hypothetical protein